MTSSAKSRGTTPEAGRAEGLEAAAGDQVAISAISLVEILYLEEKQKLPAGVLARVTALVQPMPLSVAVTLPASRP